MLRVFIKGKDKIQISDLSEAQQAVENAKRDIKMYSELASQYRAKLAKAEEDLPKCEAELKRLLAEFKRQSDEA